LGRVFPEVWDQKFLEHHFIAIAGYASSEIANVFGLANAVNTWITEVRGSRGPFWHRVRNPRNQGMTHPGFLNHGRL
jgi:hypothetical protein